MPKNTWAGVVISLFCLILGFAFIWHVWWLAIASFVGVIGSWIAYSFQRVKDYYVPVDQIEAIEGAHLDNVYQGRPEYYQQYVKSRNDEMAAAQQGSDK